MLTSFSALAAILVFYIVISKNELYASKMFETFSRKEEIGFHSMEITPIPRQGLSNGELYREQERIKYRLSPSHYLRVLRVSLASFKEIKRRGSSGTSGPYHDLVANLLSGHLLKRP